MSETNLETRRSAELPQDDLVGASELCDVEVQRAAVEAGVALAIAEWSPPQNRTLSRPALLPWTAAAAAAAALVMASGMMWLGPGDEVAEADTALALHTWNFETGEMPQESDEAVGRVAAAVVEVEAPAASDPGLIGRMDFEDGLLR